MSKSFRMAALCLAFTTCPAWAQSVEVSAAIRHDVSRPLRDNPAERPGAENHREKPLKLIKPNALHPHEDDPVVQNSAGPLVGTTGGLNFAGVGTGAYGFSPDAAPPDTNGAVGATQYVQWVNESFAVFDKNSGALLYGPTTGKSLWAGFGGQCETANDGDPIVQYDKAANRWIMTQFAVSSQPYLQCVAVSTSSDATGSYNRYAFSYGNGFNDYPKVGVWPDAYYISFNIFTNGSSFAGSKVCAYDRAKMLAGQAATQQCFQTSTSFGGLLPSDLDGSTAPPPGSPNYVVAYGNNVLQLWKFHVDWVTPANTTFTGPTNIPVAGFSAACNGGGTCIPQLGTTNKLDSLADRLMYRVAYRNFGDHESLVVNHSVTAGSSVGVRWYELRNLASSPVVFQQSTYAPDSNYRWMGSIAMDQQGNMAMGYSVSSSAMNPAIRYTGRLATDALNTMQLENSIIEGSGSQTGNLHRWGDYSAMTVDPVDDCTFWFTTEYLLANGSFNWSTRIASFKFSGCGGASNPPPTVSIVNPAEGATVSGSAVAIQIMASDNDPAGSLGVQWNVDGGAWQAAAWNGGLGYYVATWDSTSAGNGPHTLNARATDSGGLTGLDSNSVTVSNGGSAPNAPSNLRATSTGKSNINLAWNDNSTNETNFDIERCTGASCTNFASLVSVGANVTSYINTGLPRRTTFRYRVKARNSSGSSAYSNILTATTR